MSYGEPFQGNSADPVLTEQVVGGFEDGVGTFYGEEMYRGRAVRMRFLWTKPTEHSARWEQAYFDESAGEWETNWIMEFTVSSER